MTPAQYAAAKPGDVVLLRAIVFPRGARHGADAGDHVQVTVRGGATFYAPLREIVDMQSASDADAEATLISLCSERGRS
jgi:hypothetical protein